MLVKSRYLLRIAYYVLKVKSEQPSLGNTQYVVRTTAPEVL
jgi:hypothetical protein